MELTKQERFEKFLERLAASPPARSAEEALELVSTTLNGVEDDFTEIPYQPDLWQSDGRMYPPRGDSVFAVAGRADLSRYRSRGHNTYLRDNGAIEIRDTSGRVLFEKPGGDGRPLELF
jgi:hypothetical protein